MLVKEMEGTCYPWRLNLSLKFKRHAQQIISFLKNMLIGKQIVF